MRGLSRRKERWTRGLWKLGIVLAMVFLMAAGTGQQASAAGLSRPAWRKADYDKNYVTLKWKKVARANGYEVYRYSSTAGQYVYVGSTKKLQFTMQGLSQGTTFQYRVRAYRRTKSSYTASPYSKSRKITTKVQKTKQVSTIKKYLKTAISAIGNSVYIWGGGWSVDGLSGSPEARSIGVSKKWKKFFKKQDSSYNYYYHQFQRNDGLDCSGYVGWTIYNMMNTKSGNNGYVMLAQTMAKNYASRGWGKFISRSKVRSHKPGDIMSSDCGDCGHVWISLGECADGSVVVLHSTPNAGVQLSGTVAPNGSIYSQAAVLADKYMKQYFPGWYAKFQTGIRNEKYLSHYCQMRWNVTGKSVMTDPDGYQKMSANEVLADLLGPLEEDKLPEPPAPEQTYPMPEPETQAPEPETQAPEPETQAPEPETKTPEPETQTPEPETQAPETENNGSELPMRAVIGA